MVSPGFRRVSSSGLQAQSFQQALDEEIEEPHGTNSAELTMLDYETRGQQCHKRSVITRPVFEPQKRLATNHSPQGAATRSDLNGAGDTSQTSKSKQQGERQNRVERREQRTQIASAVIATGHMAAADRMVEVAGTEYHQTCQQQPQQTGVDVVVGALELVGAAQVAEVTNAAAGVAGTLVAHWGHGMVGQTAVIAGSNVARQIKRYRLNSSQNFSYGWNVHRAPTTQSNILAKVLHGKLLHCSDSHLAGTEGWLRVEEPCADEWFSIGVGSAWVKQTINFNNGWHPVDESKYTDQALKKREAADLVFACNQIQAWSRSFRIRPTEGGWILIFFLYAIV